MERVRVRQLQQAVVLYWVEVEVPEGLSPAEKAERAYEMCDDGDYEVIVGPEIKDLEEVISQEVMETEVVT